MSKLVQEGTAAHSKTPHSTTANGTTHVPQTFHLHEASNTHRTPDIARAPQALHTCPEVARTHPQTWHVHPEFARALRRVLCLRGFTRIAPKMLHAHCAPDAPRMLRRFACPDVSHTLHPRCYTRAAPHTLQARSTLELNACRTPDVPCMPRRCTHAAPQTLHAHRAPHVTCASCPRCPIHARTLRACRTPDVACALCPRRCPRAWPHQAPHYHCC